MDLNFTIRVLQNNVMAAGAKNYGGIPLTPCPLAIPVGGIGVDRSERDDKKTET